MTPRDILAQKPVFLTDAQREAYFRDGFVTIENGLSAELVAATRAVSDAFVEESRGVTASNEKFDIGPKHRPDAPHLRRLRRPVDFHPLFWEIASQSTMVDIAADLVGPDVKFHSAKLNYKWPGGGDLIKWHQDIPAWPHTNYSPVTLGVYLDDVDAPMGPLACVPGSHEGPLYSHYDAAGETWTGHLSDADAARVGVEGAVDMNGPAGSVVAINCRTVHGSRENLSNITRPLLLFVYSSADAFAWMPPPTPTSKTGEIVRGRPARLAHLDPRPCAPPPDWSKQGYGSIYSAQKIGAEKAAAE